ncbi:MAG: hypothetical protein K5888_04905 [Lachnospiraceae bacterium]|nr:hypothetical protein [Lachnospiraceae bacterium]
MATYEINEESQQFEKKLANGSLEELNELKAFLFKENIRIEMEKRELEELRKKVLEDRQKLREESDDVNKKIVSERARLKQDALFFEKKMDILKNGFESLEADRRALEKARKQFEQDSLRIGDSVKQLKNEEIVVFMFQGVNSLLSLKKRYKDLLKIFHPDNMGGDHDMVLKINQVYDELKKNYEESKII